MGRDKSAPIAALRQAKIYPAGKLRLPQSNPIVEGRNVRVAIHELNYIPCGLRQLAHCGSAAKGDDVPQLERFYTVPNKIKD